MAEAGRRGGKRDRGGSKPATKEFRGQRGRHDQRLHRGLSRACAWARPLASRCTERLRRGAGGVLHMRVFPLIFCRHLLAQASGASPRCEPATRKARDIARRAIFRARRPGPKVVAKRKGLRLAYGNIPIYNLYFQLAQCFQLKF